MRAIDADALKKRLTALVRGGTNLNYCIADMIDRALTIEPERKKGKWTLLPNGNAICSECKHIQVSAFDIDGWDNFCHHCGADMRGEQDDKNNGG